MKDPWMSAAAAADELGVSAGRVRQLLGAGQLPGRKVPTWDAIS